MAQNPSSPVIPVVLCGGAGTRLWPVSREGNPKPFMRLADGTSLLGRTLERAVGSVDADGGDIVIVTNRDYYFLARDEVEGAKLGDATRFHYLLEPVSRNTAAAVALAAALVADRFGRDAIMLVLPADHLIRDIEAFGDTVRQAAEVARTGRLVTFGITPTEPETGFGYIETGTTAHGAALEVRRFVEKPDVENARAYLASGNFLWNSGMFAFSAGVILDQFAALAPEIAVPADECWNAMAQASAGAPAAALEAPRALIEAIPSTSIDYAVMERSDAVAVIPASFDWSDIGSWTALGKLIEPDADNNRTSGDVILVGTANSFIQSDDRVVAAIGLDGITIVDTADALLVARSDQVQEVRHVVASLKARGHESFRLHRTVARPWGTYTILEEGDRFKIKRIIVKPGASLSLQLHHHRSEHWIVVQGMAKVVNGDNEVFLRTNESTYIPAGVRHRLENPGLLELAMIEVQSGEYLGEDDIVRFQDNYGRT